MRRFYDNRAADGLQVGAALARPRVVRYNGKSAGNGAKLPYNGIAKQVI